MIRMKRSIMVLLLSGLAVAWGAMPGTAGTAGAAGAAGAEKESADWPRFRGPRNDGISTENNWTVEKLKAGPKILWKATPGAGYSTVSVKTGRLYTMGNAGGRDTVWCYDAEKGTVLWKHSYACRSPKSYPGPRCTPTVEDVRVYTLSRRGLLLCLDAVKGTVVWSKNTVKELGARAPGWGLSCSPYVEGELLLVDLGTPRGSLVALNKKTGRLVWRAGADVAGYSSPVVADLAGRRTVLNFAGGNLWGVDVKTGKQLWKFLWKTAYKVNAASPVVSGNLVFIASDYGKGSAVLDLSGGRPRVVWQKKILASHFSSAVLRRGYLYGFHGNITARGALQCVELKTGLVKWSRVDLNGSLILAGDKLIVLNKRGRLSVVEASPAGFKELAGAQVLKGPSWTSPVLVGGRIYCRNHKELVCVDVRKK